MTYYNDCYVKLYEFPTVNTGIPTSVLTYRVGFSKDMSSFRVTQNNPLTAAVFYHCRTSHNI